MNSKVKKKRSTAKVMPEALVENSNEASYWLGFLMADGCVSSKTNEIKLKLKASDFQHIKNFTKYLGLPQNRVKIYKQEALVCFSSNKIKQYLISLGITPKKTFTAQLQDKNLTCDRFFWSGFFDGDGSIGISKKNNFDTPWFRIIGASKKIIYQFSKFIKSETGIEVKIGEVHKKNINYYFQIDGKRAVRLIQLLYQNNPFNLERKKLIALKAPQRYNFQLTDNPIKWETDTKEHHIWKNKHQRNIHRPFRVVGKYEYNIGGFSSLDLAKKVRNCFFELTDIGVCQEEAKKEVLARYYEYFPRRFKTNIKDNTDSKKRKKTTPFHGIGFNKKRNLFIAKLYYPSGVMNKKGDEVSILEHKNLDFVVAIQKIALKLREVGYHFEGRRKRKVNGTYIFLDTIPADWKIILGKGQINKIIIDTLEKELKCAFSLI